MSALLTKEAEDLAAQLAEAKAEIEKLKARLEVLKVRKCPYEPYCPAVNT